MSAGNFSRTNVQDDGLLDGEDGDGFDSDEDVFTHAEPFGGIDFDPEEEALEDYDDEEG